MNSIAGLSPSTSPSSEGVNELHSPTSQVENGLSQLRIQSGHREKDNARHLDPFQRLKIDRLETALQFLGLDPTYEQQRAIRQRLRVEPDGTVAYGEFVTLAQQMFSNDTKQMKFTRPSSQTETKYNSSDDTYSSEVELKWANRERDKAKIENARLQTGLHQRDLALRSTENEMLQVREELQSTLEECRFLRSRLRLAEEAQKAARRTEEDYEEALRTLETELLEAHQSDNKHKKISSAESRLLVLEHEMRKTDVEKKMFEVATERLLQFSLSVGDNLNGILKNLKTEKHSTNKELDDQQLVQKLPHAIHVIEFLAAEATKTTDAVKSLLKIENVSNGVDQTNEGRHHKHHSHSRISAQAVSQGHQLQTSPRQTSPISHSATNLRALQGVSRSHRPKSYSHQRPS